MWDARTGQELLILKGHTNWVCSVCFSPDGSRLVTASADGTARLRDVRPGQELPGRPDFPFRDNPISPDGQRFAYTQGNRVRLIDLHLSDDEIALRHWATRRDPHWHRAEAERLVLEKQPSAAALHTALADGLSCGAIADGRHAVALARSGSYPDAVLALLRAALYPPEDDFGPAP